MLLGLCAVAGAWLYFSRRQSAVAVSASTPASRTHSAASGTSESTPIDYSNEAIEQANLTAYGYAFGLANLAEPVTGEHAAILKRIGEAAESAVLQRDYFPRRPMLLPKLMQALNDPEISREALVKLLLEDPAIAGGVIQQANTAFYRVSPARVDNIDRAVWLLGTDGLRRLLATAVMQPVFRLPKGEFDAFAPITWEHAQRAAAAADSYSQGRTGCDPLVAQLLAILEPLARIVIFRLAMEEYRESPPLTPRAEVLMRAMQKHSMRLALRIAEAWEMSEVAMTALREQTERISPSSMRELSRGVYYSGLAATFTLVAARSAEAGTSLQATLRGQGLTRMETELLWQAASAALEAG